MAPSAIDATFRSLGLIGVKALQNEPGCVPQMKFSQSLNPESNTSPGFIAAAGST